MNNASKKETAVIPTKDASKTVSKTGTADSAKSQSGSKSAK